MTTNPTNDPQSFRTASGRPPEMTEAQELRVEAAFKRIAGRTGAEEETTANLTKELAAIQEQADKATEGPWVVRNGIPGPIDNEGRALEQHHPLFLAGWDGDCRPDKPEDSNFIAHARTDVEWMARALQAVVEAHQPDDVSACTACGSNESGLAIVKYPCPTIRAIEQALEVGNE